MWTIVRPVTRAAKATPPRSSTVSIAQTSTSIRNTVAQCANTSADSRATSAPAAARISALARVRFHTRSRVPALTSVSAMASPMVPRPMKPTGHAASIIEPPRCSACVHPLQAGLLLGLVSLRQIFLGQRGSGRLGLHHDAANAPAAGVFDRLNAVDAARDLLAVAVQRVAAP